MVCCWSTPIESWPKTLGLLCMQVLSFLMRCVVQASQEAHTLILSQIPKPGEPRAAGP